MTANDWSQVFDLFRGFAVAGISIGMAAALLVAASRN